MEFKREVFLDEDRNKWVVKSSCWINGTLHSLQVARNEKPTKMQTAMDHRFLEEKLSLSEFITRSRDVKAN